MTIEYWLTTYRTTGGELEHRVLGGGSAEEVRRLYRPEGLAFVDAEMREAPSFALVEPVRTKGFEHLGRMVYSTRDHLLGGGVLESSYRGREYLVVPTIFGEDRVAGTEDGEDVVHIGSVEISTPGAEPHVLMLEPLDESHAMDRLTSELILYDFGLGAAPVDAEPAAEVRTIGDAMRHGAFQGLSLRLRRASPTFVFDAGGTDYHRGEILHYAADVGNGDAVVLMVGRDPTVRSRMEIRNGAGARARVVCEIVDSDLAPMAGNPFGSWTADHGSVGHADIEAFLRGAVGFVRSNPNVGFAARSVEISDGSWEFTPDTDDAS